jgi:hypothetical protein
VFENCKPAFHKQLYFLIHVRTPHSRFYRLILCRHWCLTGREVWRPLETSRIILTGA